MPAVCWYPAPGLFFFICFHLFAAAAQNGKVFIVHLSVYIVLVDPHEELVKFKNTFCVGKRSLLRTILVFRV